MPAACVPNETLFASLLVGVTNDVPADAEFDFIGHTRLCFGVPRSEVEESLSRLFGFTHVTGVLHKRAPC